MSLASDLRLIAKTRTADMKLIMQRSLFQVGNSIIMNSPVDEGTFRGNWIGGIGLANTSTTTGVDTQGTKTSGALQAKLSHLDLGKDFFFTNALPQGEVLEYGGYSYGPKTTSEGFSKKAPEGMVGISVALFNDIVSREVKRLR